MSSNARGRHARRKGLPLAAASVLVRLAPLCMYSYLPLSCDCNSLSKKRANYERTSEAALNRLYWYHLLLCLLLSTLVARPVYHLSSPIFLRFVIGSLRIRPSACRSTYRIISRRAGHADYALRYRMHINRPIQCLPMGDKARHTCAQGLQQSRHLLLTSHTSLTCSRPLANFITHRGSIGYPQSLGESIREVCEDGRHGM